MDVVPPGTASQNQPIGVLHREFGDNPATTGGHGAAFIHGMTAAGVATTAKHFPGLGRVQGNTDFVSNVVDTTTTRDDPYLSSFEQAIQAGVPFVMVALATYTKIDPGHLAVFSPIVIKQMLRGDLGFTGVVMSDDIGEAVAIANIPPAARAVDFLSAGGDLIVSKTVAPTVEMAQALLARASSHPGLKKIVDAAALRILEAKDASGLLPCSD
jgi:beta-N-acetylhexosaminidase